MYKYVMIFLASVAMTSSGQITLIDPSTRNGGFEDGVTSPWGLVNSVGQNGIFASQGDWYGIVSALANVATARTDSYQNISTSPLGGRSFLLTFDARIGSTGFESVFASIISQNSLGIYVPPLATLLSSPPLTTNAWATYQKLFMFPDVWDGNIIRLDIAFRNPNASVGTTYIGYLDNVRLQQIPEPSSLILLGLGGSFLFSRLARKSRSKALTQQ